jgi:hypothetical protein
MVAWPGSTEHTELLSTAQGLAAELRRLRERLEHDPKTEYIQHRDFANRARNFADYLSSVILLTKTDTYAPAFANMRTALEHVLVDHLLFSGQRFIRIIVDVPAPTWAEWQRQQSSGEAFSNILDWRRKKDGVVEITYKDFRSEPDENGKSYLLSPHYVVIGRFRPYWGPASVQDQFNDGLSDGEGEKRFAKENALIYHAYLDWRSIKKNLLLNDFADETVINQLEVHYRFLSAFVHPISNVTEVIYGRNVFDTPTYDHYSSELALLYVIAFAVKEIWNFHEMTERYPSVGIGEWQTTESLCREASDKISYLWFPGQPPHQYDSGG